MPITIYIWLLIVAVCATAAICLMAGHAIGYSKADKYWKRRIARKANLNIYHNSATGPFGPKTTNELKKY